MSHDLTSGSCPRSLAEFVPDFDLEFNANEITCEPNSKKRKGGSSLARGMTNNRSEKGIFDYVVPRRAPVNYEDKMVSIGKPVEDSLDLLQVLPRFCQNPLNNSRHGQSSS